MSRGVIVLAILCLPALSPAFTYLVPADAPTIQAGLDLADFGDTVKVAHGTYTDCSHIAYDPRDGAPRTCCFELKNGVALIGDLNGPENVVVDAQQMGGVSCAFTDQGATIAGMTLRGGSSTEAWNGSGGALYVIEAVLDISSCIFEANVSPDHGGACHIAYSEVTLADCSFSENVGFSGGGLYSTSSDISISNSAFNNNRTEHPNFNSGGAGCCFSSSTAVLTSCDFIQNVASSGGGGAIKASDSNVNLSNCFIRDNSAEWGGGVRSSSNVVLTHCEISGNSASGYGGAIYVDGPTTYLIFCSLSDNTAPIGPSGFLEEMGVTELHCTSYDPSSWDGAGQVVVSDEPCEAPISVVDIPADEGGFVSVSWLSQEDWIPGPEPDVSLYHVQRLGDSWEPLVSVPSTGADTLSTVVETPDVFIIGEPPPWSQYRVVAESTAGELFYPSEIDSGYSQDNLPPPAPTLDLVEVEGYWIVTWENPDVPDLEEVCLFRGLEWDFPPGEPLVCDLSGAYIEDQILFFYYVAQAGDIHGNYGAYSNAVHPDPVGVGADIPMRNAFLNCFPNPFNPSVTITYELANRTDVSLVVYDLRGRRVCSLLKEAQDSGRHEVRWEGQDSHGRNQPAGTYVCRLRTTHGGDTIRMSLIR